jgi:rSAM/selenodomain-associated transferase 2
MSERAVITVIIPTLNEEQTLPGCLDAVGRDPEVAIVVSDGGSLDGTLQLLSRYPWVTVVRGARGRGPQLNLGASLSTSRLLLFLHADCRLPEGWMPAVTSALTDDRTSLACFRLRTLPGRADSAGPLRRLWLRLLDIRSLGIGLPYGDQGFAMRRSTFDAVGGFPEIPLMEDVALARASRAVGSIKRIPLAVATSARRFDRHPARTRLMTLTFPWLFRVGVSPWRLARWYREVR